MSGPHNRPVFFTDRDLGKRFPEILSAGGLITQAHVSHFPADCPDETWLARVGSEQWIAVTHDSRIRYKPNELRAVMTSGVRLIVVIGKAPFAELARNFVSSVAEIESFISAHPGPWIAKLYRPDRGREGTGRVTLWLEGKNYRGRKLP